MGAVRATFGSLTLVIGILLLLAGLGAAGYGYLDEQQHKEDAGPFGVARDPDRADLNEALLVGGGVAALLGLVLLVVGIVVVSTGRAAAAVASTSGEASPPTSRDPRRVGIAVAAVGALVLVAFLGLLALGGGGGQDGLFARDPENAMLEEARVDGSVGTTFTVMGGSQMPASSASSEPVPVPAGAARAEVQVTWTAASGGTERLQVTVQVASGDGWTDVETLTGPSSLWINATLDGAPELRLRVFPGEDGAVAGQDYSARIRFWSD